MEIVEGRYGRGSILITSQLPTATWHEVIGEPTLGNAILDRIVHNAYRLELDGPSISKIKAIEETVSASSPAATNAAEGKPAKAARNESQIVNGPRNLLTLGRAIFPTWRGRRSAV